VEQRERVLSKANVTRTGHLRWYICGLLFYATTVNYMDRTVLGILKPVIAGELHWTDTEYGLINSAFQLGYAVMMPLAGRLIDGVGIRIGYSVAVLFWSLASMSHAFAGSGLAKLPIFQPRSKQLRTGFQDGSGRWRPAS
jgi:MFS transporter, ACS family, hexuronate transporter